MSDKDNGMVKTLIEALNAISQALAVARYEGDNKTAQNNAKVKIATARNALAGISVISTS